MNWKSRGHKYAVLRLNISLDIRREGEELPKGQSMLFS